jgi:predicted metal-dependent phosphoesterase TrpH
LAKADLHVHTVYSEWRHMRVIRPRDCYLEPAEVYDAALAAGMDFVAVTDHDSVEGGLRLLQSPAIDPDRVIVGEEVECHFPETGQWVHVNVLGLDETDHAELQRLRDDVRAVCAYCRGRGLLHILNHPFQSYAGQKPVAAYLEDVLSLFTHVEGLNGGVTALQNRAVSELCVAAGGAGRHLVQVAGSDAHTRRRIGLAYTEAEATTAAGFLEAVRDGRCRVGGSAQSLWGLVRDVHSVIGEYYGRLYRGRGDAATAPSYALDLVVAIQQTRQKLASRAVLDYLSTDGIVYGAWVEGPRDCAQPSK